MVVVKSYKYPGEENLKDLMAKQIGACEGNVIYLGTIRAHQLSDIYHIDNTIGLVGLKEISFVAMSEDEAKKAKKTIDTLLNTELMKI